MLTIENARNPQYMNSDGTQIDLLVKFAEVENELPFTATAKDDEPYCAELFNNAINGVYGEIAPYIDPYIDATIKE